MHPLLAIALLPVVAGVASGEPASAAQRPSPEASSSPEADAALAELREAVTAKRALLDAFLEEPLPPPPDRVHAGTAPLDRKIAGARGALRLAGDRRLAEAEASVRELATLERRLFDAFIAAQDHLRALSERIDELRARAEGLERSAARREAEAGLVPISGPARIDAPATASRASAPPALGRSLAPAGGHEGGGEMLWAQEHRDAARAEREEAARLRSELAALEREAAALAAP